MRRQIICGNRMMSSAFTALVFLLGMFSPAFSETYYVSPQGADTNNGMSAAPFASPQKGLDVAKPGDKVLVRAGVYRGRVVFPRSGEPGKPIILEGEEGAILDGGEVVKDWQPAPEVAPGVYKKLIDIPEWSKIGHENAPKWRHHPLNLTWNNKLVLHIRAENMKEGMERLKDPPESENWKGIEALFGTTNDITYLRFGDCRDPNKGEITVAPHWEYDEGATVLIKGKNHIVVRGFLIRNRTVGIQIRDGASDNIIENNTIIGGKYGVFIGYYIWAYDVPKNAGKEFLCHRNHIRNNQITLNFIAKIMVPAQRFNRLWDQFKDFSDNDREGVFLRSTGHDNEVSGNHIFEHWGGIQDCPDDDKRFGDKYPVVLPRAQFCQRLKVYNNVVHDIMDDGLEPTGGQIDAEWHHNTVYNCNVNIRLKFGEGGPCYIYCNRLFNPPQVPGATLADFFHFMDTMPAKVYVYHNLSASYGGNKIGKNLRERQANASEHCANEWYVNNIFANYDFGNPPFGGLPGGAHADYNMIASESKEQLPPKGAHNIFIPGKKWVPVNPLDPGFTLKADSPAREKGLDLSREWTLDGVKHPALPGMAKGYFKGAKPDLGAAQYGGK